MAELFFGDFRFDTRRLRLEGPEGEVEVRPKTLELLTYLIQNHNRFVPRRELMDHLWSEVTVTASSLTQCISELRQALGDSAQDPHYVETRVKLGYRFVATVYHRPTEHLEPLPPPPARQDLVQPHRKKIGILAGSAAAVVLIIALGGWYLAHRSSPLTPVVVIPPANFGAGEDEASRALTEKVRLETFARLVDLADVTVTADSIAADGAPGLHVEFLCRRPAPDEVELSVSLRRLENGESVWGWTWTTYGTDADHDRVAAEVADRVVTAVRARL